MTTPPNISGKWTAELEGRESWRNLDGQPFNHWWDAAKAVIDEECGLFRDEVDAMGGGCRDTDDEIMPDSTEIRVGIMDNPKAPETLYDGGDIIDMLRNTDHDDYSLECCGCESWLCDLTEAQHDDLTGVLREGIRSWLDAHKLRPTWFVIRQSWTVTAGEARKAAAEAKEKV